MKQRACYLDASALVKLVLDEPESGPLRLYLAAVEARQLTSVVSGVEVPRAVRRFPGADQELASAVLHEIHALALDPGVVRLAATLDPPGLRSLDAIHLASALSVQSVLAAFVTYDDRLAAAARLLGLPVEAPA